MRLAGSLDLNIINYMTVITVFIAKNQLDFLNAFIERRDYFTQFAIVMILSKMCPLTLVKYIERGVI